MTNLYVPVDPTDEMLNAAVKGTRANISYEDARAIYEAMTEAAPKVKREEHFVLHFQSTRNGMKDDQPRMQGIQAFPTLVLVDRQGRIVWRDQGATPITLARLDRFLASALRTDSGVRRY